MLTQTVTTRTTGSRYVLSYLMLLVLALFSFGITTTAARVSLGKVTQSEAEEIEESVGVTSPRRRESVRLLGRVAIPIARFVQRRDFVRNSQAQRAIVGHRHANGLLAPIRC
ncbi:hypothetical protein [Planctomycetes bacterium K23_9]|uniref:Uncharacterized protein n=1 Tax=Stieleria marina TaxID=1930275 RepID=A0A517NVH4_9BACT|nr:hypothetical protein K239x_31150 [Planctomycetes bacterium K23_9]